MSKKFDLFLCVLFCGFLGGALALSLVLPKREFSPLENRYLQKPPKLTLQTLEEGKFMEDAEDYVSDHIAGRDLWVSMKSWCERLSGKKENNGIYFAAGQTLISRVEDPDPDKLAQAAGCVDALVGNVSVPVYFGLIPSSAAVWRDKLPAGAPTADEFSIIDRVYASTKARPIDIAGALNAHRGEAVYYRTDHHWTSLGAFYGANALLEAVGLDPLVLSDYEKTTVTREFNGTLFSSSGVRWLPPDEIDTYIPADGVKVTSWFTHEPTQGSLYVDSCLEEKDKYSYFLGGRQQPLCVIETGRADAPSILIVRDSYSDSLAPFLTRRFSEIHLIDLRNNLNSVKTYVEEHQIDCVAVLYSFPNFISEKNLPLLGR